MSRHGRRGRHPHPGQGVRPRPSAPAQERNGSAQDALPRADAYRPRPEAPAAPAALSTPDQPRAFAPGEQPAAPAAQPPPGAVAAPAAPSRPAAPPEVHAPAPRPDAAPRPEPAFRPGTNGAPLQLDDDERAGGDRRPTCTAAQLRRFIKSRPWVPLHELRRRFGIAGGDDDVTPVRVGSNTVFIGLPGPEARLMGELLSAGDVGYELSLDPGAPIVVGVYPMRPVARG